MTKLRYAKESLHELLLKSVREDGLKPYPDAPTWAHELGAAFQQDLGLLAINGPSGLTEDLPGGQPARIAFGAADNVVLLLAREATRHRKHLGIAVPPGTVMLPLLIVCKTLLGDLIERHDALGTAQQFEDVRERGGILLVSPDVELRARYFSVRVGKETVVESYPACRMRRDGTVVSVHPRHSRGPDQLPVCFFLAHQRELPSAQQMEYKPALVVLDLVHDRWRDRLDTILDWCIRLKDAQGKDTTALILLPEGDTVVRDALWRRDIARYPLTADAIDELERLFRPVSLPNDPLLREVCATWSFAPFAADKPLEREHTIIYIGGEATTDTTDAANSVYRTLDAVRENFQSHRDIRLARWLVGTLMQLPIPLEWYEEQAYLMGNRQTLKKLISSLGSNGSGGMHPSLAPVLQSMRGELEQLYRRLSLANPKSQAFRRYVLEALPPILERGEHAAYLARNEVVARALWPWLMSEGVEARWQPQLQALTYKQLDGRITFDKVVATGCWPQRYRWQLGGRLGRSLDFLLYADEVAILEQQMAHFYARRARERAQRARFAVLRSFDDIQCSPASDTSATVEDANGLVLQREGAAPLGGAQQAGAEAGDDVEAFDTDEMSLFAHVAQAELGPDDGSIEPMATSAPVPQWPRDPSTSPRSRPHWADDGDEPLDDEQVPTVAAAIGTAVEECVRITVRRVAEERDHSDEYLLYLPIHGTTECYVPGRNDEGIISIANDEIEPGVILVRTDEGDRQTLFDRVVQLADAQPTMKYLAKWRQYWLDAIDRLVQKHTSGRPRRGAYRHLQQELQRAGVQVTRATVRDWVLGMRIGPARIETIRAIGALAQHPLLEQYPDRADAALNQIRSVHRALGRRINAALERLGKSARRGVGGGNTKRETKRDFSLDPALAVPIDDLIDLLEFYEIVAADHGPWQIPVGRIGVLLTAPRAEVSSGPPAGDPDGCSDMDQRGLGPEGE